MKPIFNQTINRMFRLKNVLIYLGIVLVPSVIIALAARFNSGGGSLSEIKTSINAIFMLLVFLWLTGIPYIVNIVSHGTGLFASEESEGTMSLLVSKPVRRSDIVFGKILALITASFIYQIISIVLSYFVFYFFSGIDVDVIVVLISTLPGVLLYSLFVTIFFSALSSAMSMVFKKKVAGIVISLLFLFVAFGIFPVIRSLLMFENLYVTGRVYLFDFNYHFGLIFHNIMSSFNSDLLSSSAMTIVGAFTGVYANPAFDMDVVAFMGYGNSGGVINYINPILLTSTYLIVAVLLFVFVFVRMERKDIN